eukprot:scaffold470_cov71-Phaeocystis_antarctica.AAC.1
MRVRPLRRHASSSCGARRATRAARPARRRHAPRWRGRRGSGSSAPPRRRWCCIPWRSTWACSADRASSSSRSSWVASLG